MSRKCNQRLRWRPGLKSWAVELKDRIAYSSQMRRATLIDTKNNLSALVDKVQHGETNLILDRGRPVAGWSPFVEREMIPKSRLPAWNAKDFCAEPRLRSRGRS